MEVNRVKCSVRNIIAGFISKIIALFVPFVIRTLIIQRLGVEYLGLNSLFASILQMLSLSELGFGSAIVYSMYKPIAQNDEATICAMLNFYKSVYRGIGLIILISGIALAPFIDIFFDSSPPKEINIYIIYFLYLINTSISYFLFAYKSSILDACLRNDVNSVITTSCNLAMYIVQACVLIFYSNYYFYVIILPITTLIMNIARAFVVNKMYPQYKTYGKLQSKQIKEIKNRVLGLIGHKIGGTVFSSVDNIVISAFLGLEVLGKYTNYYYIYTALNGFTMIIYQSITAVLGNSLVCKSVEENYKDFNVLFWGSACITIWSSSCMLCLYQPFMALWMGKSNMLSFNIAVLLVIYYFINSMRRVCITYKDAAGMWIADFWKPYASIAVNLVLNIILVQIIGLAGVIISSIIACTFIELPWETAVFFKHFFKRKNTLYYIDFFKLTLASVFCWLLSFALCYPLNVTISGLILRGLICTLGSVATIFFFFRNSKNYINFINRIKLWRLRI